MMIALFSKYLTTWSFLLLFQRLCTADQPPTMYSGTWDRLWNTGRPGKYGTVWQP